MGRNSWYNKWEQKRIFELRHNRINDSSYVFSYFPRTNQYGFQDGKVSALLNADLYARFFRLKGNNVLFPVGFHSLGASSILEGRKSGTDDGKINDMFYNQLRRLGIGINSEKLIDMKEDVFLRLLQTAFIDFYEKGYIIYKNKVVYYDEKTNKIYKDGYAKKNLKQINQKCFLLNIKPFINEIINEIDELDIDKKYKKEMKEFLSPKEVFVMDLSITNKKTLTIKMLEPEYLGGLSYIFLNPDYIDVSLYVTEDEKENMDLFLKENPIMFSGNYAINPLTGDKIPVCISRFYKEAIYLGIPAKDEEDYAIALECGFITFDVVVDDVMVNSDFLDDLDKNTAHNKIIEEFIDAGIGRLNIEYINDEINLLSLDNYGPLFPFLENNMELVSLKKNLPFKFSNQYRFSNHSFKNEDGEVLGGTINNLFIEGITPFISIFYDKYSAFDSIFSKEALETFNEWLPIDLMVVDEKSVLSQILMPLAIFKIFKKEFKLNYNLTNKILISSKVVDVKLDDIKRINNNLIDFDRILEKFYSDSIRYFVLSNEINEIFEFNLYSLSDMDKYVKELKDVLINLEIGPNYDDDVLFRNLKLDVLELLRLYKTNDYIKLIINFTNKHIFNKSIISKGQLLRYLQLISPIFPYLAEEIYELKINKINSIYNEGI